MSAWDRQAELWIVGHRVAVLNPLFEALSFIGTFALVWMVIAAGFAVARRMRTAVVIAAAAITAEVTTDALKLLFDRARPTVDALVHRPASGSFPSGHSATSFACATVIAGLEPRFRIAAFALAGGIAASRLYVGVHYPTDVVAGAAWGVAIGLSAISLMRRSTDLSTVEGS